MITLYLDVVYFIWSTILQNKMFRLLSKSQFAGSINKVLVRNFSLVHRSELQFLNSNVTSLRPISQLQNYFTKLKLVLLEKVLRFLWYILYREKTCLSSHLITTQIINDFHIYCRDLFDKFFFFFLFDSTTSKVLLKKSYLSLLRLMSARARLFLQTCFSKVSSSHNTYLPQNFFLKNSLSLSFVDSAVNLVSNMHFSRSNNSFIINYRVYDSFFSFLRGVRSEKCAPAVQSTSSIFFIRYQRRYNKRRYSRVRSLSRSPFFAGTALSALLAAMFYGGTHKSVDWLTIYLTVFNVNILLFIFVFYFFGRALRAFGYLLPNRYQNKTNVFSQFRYFAVKYIFKRLF